MKRNFDEWLITFKKSIANYGYYVDFAKVYNNVDNIKVRRKHFDLFLDTDIGKVQVEVNAQSQKYIHMLFLHRL